MQEKAATRAQALLWVLLGLCPGLAWGQDKPAVLMFDSATGNVAGARTRLGFERLPAENEPAVWADPGGKLDDIAVSLLAGGGLIGAAVADARAQEQRNASIAPLRQAMEQESRLQRLMEGALRDAMKTNGYVVNSSVRSIGMNQGFALQALKKPADGIGVAVQKIPGAHPVALSWDDRQPLLAMDIRFYRNNGSNRMPIRELDHRIVRYVGQQAPSGTDPVAYWSARDGAAFFGEVEQGLQHMLSLVWNDTVEVPKVPRKEVVSLQVGETTQTFPGRLWKQEGGFAYLFNKDGGITVVATGSPPQQ